MVSYKRALGNIALWALLWLFFWGIYFYKSSHFLVAPSYVLVFYFFSAGVIALAIFKEHLSPLGAHFTFAPWWRVFFAVATIQTGIYVYLPRFAEEPVGYFLTYPYDVFLRLGFGRMCVKMSEIFFQQVFIAVLVMLLKERVTGLSKIIFLFGLMFGAAHIPLVYVAPGLWSSWYFFGFSIVSAFVFPPLILMIRHGFVYSYIVHWFFYSMTAAGFWFFA